MEITPFYHMSTTAKRNFFTALRGKQSFTGSLPNMILLNGQPLRFPLGTVATTGASPAGSQTVSGAHSKGSRKLTLNAIGSHAAQEYIQVDSGTAAEVRQISAVNGAVLTLDYPLMQAHSGGVNVKTVGAPYIHTITEAVDLDTVTWNVQSLDSGETTANTILTRYVGGKIGSASISAQEGGMLTMSWDGVQFLDMLHNQSSSSAVSGNVSKYSASLLTPTVTLPTTEPYYFSQGAITLFGVEFARIRNFTININNNVTPLYFIRDQATGRIPHEMREGQREYTMSATIVPNDSYAATSPTRSMFKELLTEGNYGSGMAGFDITLTFTRGTNDTIVFTIPNTTTAATGGNAQGAYIRSAQHAITTEPLTQADVDILFRSLKVVITDSVGTYA